MSVIGEKLADFTAKMTSATISKTGNVLNMESDLGPFGTATYTTTFGAPIDSEGVTGQITEQGTIFGLDGGMQTFVSSGTWRKTGHHRWKVTLITLSADGQRTLSVEEYQLASRSSKGTVYQLD